MMRAQTLVEFFKAHFPETKKILDEIKAKPDNPSLYISAAEAFAYDLKLIANKLVTSALNVFREVFNRYYSGSYPQNEREGMNDVVQAATVAPSGRGSEKGSGSGHQHSSCCS